MSYTVENAEKNRVKLTIEVSAEVFEEGMAKSYKKNVKYINLPGFRKGKAPRKMIEKMYGPSVFYEDAVNFVIPDAYDNAIDEAGIKAVSQPEIDIVSIGEENKPFVFSALVWVSPEVKLSTYKGVEIEKVENKVSAADVKAELESMREKNSRLVSVERAAKKNDIATIDFEGFVDGVAFEGGKGENYDLTLGSGTFIPGFEDQIIGKKIDSEFDVNVTFPENYGADNLSGKEAVFKCALKALKVKELPALDDEFAKDVSEFDTLDELKADIKAKLKKAADEKTKREVEDRALAAIVEGAEIDLPECMVENQVARMYDDYAYRLKSQGMDIDLYLQYTQMSEESLKEQMKPSAKNFVLGRLCLEKIAELEKITATDDDIAAEFKKIADAYKMEADKVKEIMGANIEEMKIDIVNNKALDLIASKAKQVVKEVAEEKAEAKEEAPAKKPAAKKTTTKKAEGEAKPAAKKTTTKKTTAKKEEK